MEPHNATIEREQRVWLSVQVRHQHVEKGLRFLKKKSFERSERPLATNFWQFQPNVQMDILDILNVNKFKRLFSSCE